MSNNTLISRRNAISFGLFFGGLYACCGVMTKHPKYQIVGAATLTGSILGAVRCAHSCSHFKRIIEFSSSKYQGDGFDNRFKRVFYPMERLVCTGMGEGLACAVFGMMTAYAAQADFSILKLKAKVTPYQLLPYQVVGKTAIWILKHVWMTYVYKGSSMHQARVKEMENKCYDAEHSEGEAFCDMYNFCVYPLGELLETAVLVAAIILSRKGYFQWRPLPRVN